mmetsp:Transcript_3213/g.9016  ORF Transcript_3213/g.9016 Transcript_3213/m.9016 type:complete len:237 (-) Transcript_3213:225-935(-)
MLTTFPPFPPCFGPPVPHRTSHAPFVPASLLVRAPMFSRGVCAYVWTVFGFGWGVSVGWAMCSPHFAFVRSAIGGCNVSAQNVSDENVSHGWQMIPGWYWLPKTEGGQGIESKGINVDSWGGIFGAVRWQRHASQQLKEDAADMAWLADSDAATPNLKKRVSLRSADRKAWETRLASQLGKFSKGLAGIEQLDSVDGCKCAGSSDEDVGPRCSCSGQPDISSAKDEWSPSEVTSWS